MSWSTGFVSATPSLLSSRMALTTLIDIRLSRSVCAMMTPTRSLLGLHPDELEAREGCGHVLGEIDDLAGCVGLAVEAERSVSPHAPLGLLLRLGLVVLRLGGCLVGFRRLALSPLAGFALCLGLLLRLGLVVLRLGGCLVGFHHVQAM